MSRAVVSVREEEPADANVIRDVNELAFGRPAEARLVAFLRDRDGILLSLVAVAAGRVVGHILFTPVSITEALRGAGLGPMAVSPSFQRRGIGSALISHGTARLRQRGCPFVVVLGHPAYYSRLGFEVASRHGLRCQWDVPETAFMVLLLKPGPLPTGLVRYRDEFATVT